MSKVLEIPLIFTTEHKLKSAYKTYKTIQYNVCNIKTSTYNFTLQQELNYCR